MQGHVIMTRRILENVEFPDKFAMVPEWAASHHELLNGKGYPDHKKGDEIPREVRILTILDIFEALTAKDRPYKKPLKTEKSLQILWSMVEEGAIDGELLALFEESRAWE
jgi:HD-GYP domain-containing protein (c-di-GMP phosphodiesterase class II)